jgi:hypothetical protein
VAYKSLKYLKEYKIAPSVSRGVAVVFRSGSQLNLVPTFIQEIRVLDYHWLVRYQSCALLQPKGIGGKVRLQPGGEVIIQSGTVRGRPS